MCRSHFPQCSCQILTKRPTIDFLTRYTSFSLCYSHFLQLSFSHYFHLQPGLVYFKCFLQSFIKAPVRSLRNNISRASNLRSVPIFVSLWKLHSGGHVAVRENVWEPLKLGLISRYRASCSFSSLFFLVLKSITQFPSISAHAIEMNYKLIWNESQSNNVADFNSLCIPLFWVKCGLSITFHLWSQIVIKETKKGWVYSEVKRSPLEISV